jgi:hypothetical protein
VDAEIAEKAILCVLCVLGGSKKPMHDETADAPPAVEATSETIVATNIAANVLP